ISGASRTIFPSLIAISRQSTDVLFGRTTRAFLMTVSKSLSIRRFPGLFAVSSDSAADAGTIRCYLVNLVWLGRFYQQRPMLDAFAYKDRAKIATGFMGYGLSCYPAPALLRIVCRARSILAFR